MISSIGSMVAGFLTDALYLLPAILVAISFHEWAHAYAAYRLGDPTARNLGRMTINPLAHIDPMGFIMLLLVRFGWAKPVPINTRNFKKPRRDELIVSLAGVSVNFLLAFFAVGVYFLIAVTIGFQNDALARFILLFYSINLGLCVFNLLPVPPLDGFHVFETIFIRKLGPNFFYNMERYGPFVLFGLMLTGMLSRIIGPIISGISGLIFAFYSLIFGLG